MPTTIPANESFTLSGRPIRTPRAYYPTESLELNFAGNETLRSELAEMMHMADWGAEPVVFVPYDAEQKVYLGSFPMTLPGNRALIDHYDMSGISLIGYPFVKRIA